jgi:hypothetical protein
LYDHIPAHICSTEEEFAYRRKKVGRLKAEFGISDLELSVVESAHGVTFVGRRD